MLLAISLSLFSKVDHMANLFQYLTVREMIMKTKLWVFYIKKNIETIEFRRTETIFTQKLVVNFTNNYKELASDTLN